MKINFMKLIPTYKRNNKAWIRLQLLNTIGKYENRLFIQKAVIIIRFAYPKS